MECTYPNLYYAYSIQFMVRKDKITISVDHELIEWLDSQVKKKRFSSRSHGFEYTFSKFREEE